MYDAVSAGYGPVSGNVGIEKSFGGAKVTHDGVSIAREVYLEDAVEDMAAGKLYEASEKSNQISGDGTSATILLGYRIHEKANQRVSAGFNPMLLRRGIDKASLWIKDQLDSMSVAVAGDDLMKVASVSASDPEVGKLVADTVTKVGGVGITVEQYQGLGVMQDVVDGLYFEKGWTMPHFVTDRTTEEAVHDNVSILVVEKHIKQNQDIVPIIEMVYSETEHKTLLIVGNVGGQALETCALTNLGGKVKICVVSSPVYGDQELPFLEDVAILTGGKVVPSSLPASKVTTDYLGDASKVTVTKTTTTIFEGQGDKKAIKERINIVKDQLQSDKYSAFQKERMELRLAKLQGKIGIIKVGGATQTEADEMKDRVEDAVHATRAAKEEGVVPGGATTLARLSDSKLPEAPVGEVEGMKVVFEALVEPFKQLMTNAGEDGGYRLQQMLKSVAGYGFDVKGMTDEPIILNNILDPVTVMKSVVENACSYAGMVITIPLTITYNRQWQLDQVQLNKANR
jgi:chaperonin GroEL